MVHSNQIIFLTVYLCGIVGLQAANTPTDASCDYIPSTKNVGQLADCTNPGTFPGVYRQNTATTLACAVCTASSCGGVNLADGCADPTGCRTEVGNPSCPTASGANQCKTMSYRIRY